MILDLTITRISIVLNIRAVKRNQRNWNLRESFPRSPVIILWCSSLNFHLGRQWIEISALTFYRMKITTLLCSRRDGIRYIQSARQSGAPSTSRIFSDRFVNTRTSVPRRKHQTSRRRGIFTTLVRVTRSRGEFPPICPVNERWQGRRSRRR